MLSNEFEKNQQGVMTAEQRRFLLWQCVFEAAFYLIMGGIVGAMLFQVSWVYGSLIFILGGYSLFRVISIYRSELLFLPAPKLRVGAIRKYQYRTYMVVIDYLHLKSDGKMWSELAERELYEIYYTPKSKWLLSYRRVTEQSETATS